MSVDAGPSYHGGRVQRTLLAGHDVVVLRASLDAYWPARLGRSRLHEHVASRMFIGMLVFAPVRERPQKCPVERRAARERVAWLVLLLLCSIPALLRHSTQLRSWDPYPAAAMPLAR